MIQRVLFLLFFPFGIWAQNHSQLTLLSHWNDPNLPIVDGDQVWNDLIGWNDSIKNKEYLIAGSTDSIYAFDITNPLVMIKCDVEEGHSRGSINRDYEIYDHYLYCVSDRSQVLGSLQIFDLQYLPDSLHKVYDNDTFSVNSHTCFIEAERKRLYLCGNNHQPFGTWSMAAFDLTNPENPAFIGAIDKTLGCSYTHEVYVRHDTAYCSCGDGLYVYDLRDFNNQQLVWSTPSTYPQKGYNHSSWLDSSGNFLMFTDETQGMGIKIYDITNRTDPQFVTVWNSHPGALPHNAYWKGGFAYVSSYEDGVYIYDLRNIAQFSMWQIPPTAAFYDTYPNNANGVYNGFHGCWGVWPYLKSGNIIASDISEGLFVFGPASNLGLLPEKEDIGQVTIWPNPVQNTLNYSFRNLEGLLRYAIVDASGRVCDSGYMKALGGQLDLTQLPAGVYELRMSSNQGTTFHKKLMRTD